MSTSDRECRPTSTGEAGRLIGSRFEEGGPGLLIAGGRTSLPTGRGGEFSILSTAELNRVIDYPARDMTVTVEAGLRVEDLQKLLAEENQRLPVDIAEPHRATIGGAIATNTSGPGRFGHGTFRDYVLGIRAVDGRGRVFSAGGRVVKNVAGYDLCKLMIGSRGSLALLTEVTLKLRPRPESRRLVWASFERLETIDEVLATLLSSRTRPTAIDLLNPLAAQQVETESKASLPTGQPVLCIGFEGLERETSWQIETLSQEWKRFSPSEFAAPNDETAEKIWTALTEYVSSSDDPVSFQASLLPSRTAAFVEAATRHGIAVQAHAGSGIVVGHLPDRCSSPEEASALLLPLQQIAAQCGGGVRLLNVDPSWTRSPLQVPPPSPLAERLRATFDPAGLFSPLSPRSMTGG